VPRPRGRFLAVFGFVYIAIGYSYLTVPASAEDFRRYHVQLLLCSLPVWGGAWLLAGATAMACGLAGWMRPGFAAAYLMPAVWALCSTLSWVFGILGFTAVYSTRGLLTAAVWMLATVAVYTVSGFVEPPEAPR
jgi:hypothetical protein